MEASNGGSLDITASGTGDEFLNEGIIGSGVTITLTGTGTFVDEGVLDAQIDDTHHD